MPLLNGLRTDARSEAAYRRGFQEGVRATLAAVEDSLSPAQRQLLTRWSEEALEEWRLAAATSAATPAAPSL